MDLLARDYPRYYHKFLPLCILYSHSFFIKKKHNFKYHNNKILTVFHDPHYTSKKNKKSPSKSIKNT